MTTAHRFTLGQEVRILAIDSPGRVRAIQLDIQGISYKVTYWHDCKLCVEWVYEDELIEGKL